jgi:hypothetical protein
VLVDALGWEWVFFVNVPVAVIAGAAVPFFVRESRDAAARRNFDLTGALLATLGIVALVLGIIRTDAADWGSAQVLGLFALAVALLAAFAFVESRVAAPLVPPSLLRSLRAGRVESRARAQRGVLPRHVLPPGALPSGGLGDSALEAGLHFVPMGSRRSSAPAWRRSSSLGSGRERSTWGAVVDAASLYLLSRTGGHGSYAADLLPGFIVFGAAIPLIGVANQITAVSGVPHAQAGAASGIVNAAFQVGGALGLATVTTLANSRVADELAAGASRTDALSAGFERGLLVAALLAAANVVVGLVAAPRMRPDRGRGRGDGLGTRLDAPAAGEVDGLAHVAGKRRVACGAGVPGPRGAGRHGVGQTEAPVGAGVVELRELLGRERPAEAPAQLLVNAVGDPLEGRALVRRGVGQAALALAPLVDRGVEAHRAQASDPVSGGLRAPWAGA